MSAQTPDVVRAAAVAREIGIDLSAARARVGSLIAPSPLLPAAELTHELKRPVWLKCENLQETGSFKVRGAVSCLLALAPDVRARGVVTCSSGNHGRAVSWVAAQLGIPATVFVPEWVDLVKLAAIRASGADARSAGRTYDEAEHLALAFAEQHDLAFVSPFDDTTVIAGQATVGLEIAAGVGCAEFEVAVPLSGGGLVAGIAVALGMVAPGATVSAVSAERADVMLKSLEAGRPLELPEEETMAGALAGGIGLENRYTFRLVREGVARHLRVSEAQIASAVGHAALQLHMQVEGGGAVALAAARAGDFTGDARPLVIVLSGGNIEGKTLAGTLAQPA
jgi:threonine dehydratase